MSHPDKFATMIWWENADKAADLAARMAAPGYVVTPADAQWMAGTAGNYRDARWHAEHPDDILVVPGGSISSSPHDFTYPPGQAVAFQAAIAGEASASVNEGGAGLYGGVFDSLPSAVSTASFQSWGAKAIYGLAIRAGQYLVVYSQAAQALAGRADVR